MSSGPLVPRNDPKHGGSRELQATSPAEFLRPSASGIYSMMPAEDSSLRDYFRIFMKRKWMIASIIVGIVGAVAVASLHQTKIYEAMCRIVVNKADSNLVMFKDSQPVIDYSDQSDLDTETRILQSDFMALQVIRQLNLDQLPEYGGGSDQKHVNLAPDPLQSDSRRVSALLGAFRSHLHVSVIQNTRII